MWQRLLGGLALSLLSALATGACSYTSYNPALEPVGSCFIDPGFTAGAASRRPSFSEQLSEIGCNEPHLGQVISIATDTHSDKCIPVHERFQATSEEADSVDFYVWSGSRCLVLDTESALIGQWTDSGP